MNNKPNEIVALEWLMTPLNETLTALHEAWQNDQTQDFAHFAEQFHALGNVFTVANLPLFAGLSYELKNGCLALLKADFDQIYSNRLFYASRLLQYEFVRHIHLGADYHLAVGLRIHYLRQLAKTGGDEPTDRFSGRLPLFTNNESAFNAEIYGKLARAWEQETESLKKKGVNDKTTLGNLVKVVGYLKQGTSDHTLQSIWHMAGLWLASLANNEIPKPDRYAEILSDLGNAIAIQQGEISEAVVLSLENTLVDIYAQIGDLKSVTQDTRTLFSILNDSASEEQAFFPHILGMLESVLFAFAQGDVHLSALEEVKERLGQRGWSFYENYTAEIIKDIKTAQASEMLDQMQWQLNTQLQDLYAGILSTHESIESKVGESIALHDDLSKQETSEKKQSPERIRRVRILVEELKLSFGDYLHSKNIDELPDDAILVELEQTFGEMGMYEVVAVVEKVSELVLGVQESNPAKLSWKFADSVTDGLSLLELFLDGLAKRVFDNGQLEKSKICIEEALEVLDSDEELSEFAEPVRQDDGVVRYDDSGEIVSPKSEQNPALAFTALAGVAKTQSAQETTEAVAQNQDNQAPIQESQTQAPANQGDHEAYWTIKNGLPADNFDFDADIREIFVEEAEEVVNELNDLLPTWERDVGNLAVLKDIRRGFHTLKGSGRMVGAFSVGELAWSVENMLNRVLDKSIASTPEIAKFVVETTQIVPVLVQDYSNDNPPSIDPALTIMRANNALAGKPLDSGVPSNAPAQEAVQVPVSEAIVEQVVEISDHQETAPTVSETVVAVPDDNPEAVLAETAEASESDDVQVGVKNDVAQPTPSQTPTEMTQKAVGANGLPAVLLPFIEEANAPAKPSVEVDEVDDDIKEIFIEEAGEVLESIVPLFAKWKGKASDKAQLTDIRRGFHTLKGSGRMVGAVALGELAWSVENMMNRLLDGTIVVNDGILVLIGDVLDAFGELIKIFEQGLDEYPAKMKLWQAVAHAYSKGHGGEFDYQAVMNADVATPANQDKAVAHSEVAVDLSQIQDNAQADEAVSDTAQKSKPSADALQAIQEASAIMQVADFAQAQSDEEAELCALFVEEAKELLDEVKQFLDENAYKDEIELPDAIVRVFHTLRGASGLAPLADIGTVGATIEKGLQGLQQHESKMNAGHLKALGHAVRVIGHHLHSYESEVLGIVHEESEYDQTQETTETIAEMMYAGSGLDKFEVGGLIDGIDTLLDADLELESMGNESEDLIVLYAETMLADIEILEGRTQASNKFQRLLRSLSSAYQVVAKHPEQLKDDALLDKLLLAHGQVTGLLDSVAGSMALSLDEQVVGQLDSHISDIQGYYTAIDRHDLVVKTDESAPVADEEEVAETVEYQAIETDAELLEIFLEEAGELDTAIGEAFGQWRDDPTNTDALKALQRHLHTIKGGARLAGISSVGDLTHEAETAYEQMVDGRLTASVGWVKIMQGVQDILSLQLEEIRNNNRSFFAHGAVKELQEFLAQKTVADTASVTLPVLASQTEVVTVAQEESKEQDEPVSDFVRMQHRSWHGAFPDSDILKVFLEESEEIVENSAEDFQAFRSNTGDIATLQSLQRHLHTIKGGARMIGASGVADLAHHMESVYEDLGQRRRPATRMVTQLLLSCHDWLSQAMQLLKAVYNPPKPIALIDALEAFSRHPDSLTEVPVVSLVEQLNAVAEHEALEKQRRGGHDISTMPPMKGFSAKSDESGANNEMIRISASMMERMINLSGEAAINRARIDMNITSLVSSIEEMGATVQRLADQLRRMDIELEAQILAQIDDKSLFDYEGFDPLEMDQYSSLNQLSKSLSESASDLLDLKATMLEKTRDGENLLLQLSRTQTELQDGLMHSRMVPFSRLTPRLQRIVRQVSSELGKNVELSVVNADDEMDRTILERITSPLEHMLRNAIDHGIEMPDEREAVGKHRTGRVVLEVVREGSEILVHLTDDGAGINVDAVRKKAIKQGLIKADDDTLSDLDIMQYIFNAGLSTTNVITQISGRGVGMDVVRSEIRQLGGSVAVTSERGHGSRFTMRVPLTVAVSDTLVVRAADRHYAIPLVQIERVVQADPTELLAYYRSSRPYFQLGGEGYRLRYLNEILSGHNFSELMSTNTSVPVIVIKNQTGQNLALHVDEIVGSRVEVVVKPLSRQLSNVAGISSATIMGDGSVMFILDLMALVRNARVRTAVPAEEEISVLKRPTILVVDDSVTVRKVTSRFLERQGFEAVVAKDGVDALEILQELTPDLMLLDIEMPRMDGFEVATQVRHNARLKDLPIIMITSRTGEKHRERAFEIGVSDYMGKPFQEADLLARIQELLTVKG